MKIVEAKKSVRKKLSIAVLIILLIGALSIPVNAQQSQTEERQFELLKEVLKQIKEEHMDDLFDEAFKKWDGKTFEEVKVPTPGEKPVEGEKRVWRRGIRIGNITFYFATDDHPNPPAEWRDKAGEVYPLKPLKDRPATEQGMLIMLDSEDLDLDKILFKVVVFHELIHVGLIRHDFGYRDPVTKKATYYWDPETGQFTGKGKWRTHVLPYHEAIAHLKTLILLQGLAEKNPEIANNVSYQKAYKLSLQSFEDFLDKTMKAKFKGKYEKMGEKIKETLEKYKDKVIEKKLEHAFLDGKFTKKEQKHINKIRIWLGMSVDEYKQIYKKITFRNLEQLKDTYNQHIDKTPGLIKWGFGGQTIIVHIDPYDTSIGKIVYGLQTDGNAKIVYLQEGGVHNPTMELYINESTIYSIAHSIDPVIAFQVALKDGHIMVTGIKGFIMATGAKAHGIAKLPLLDIKQGEAKSITYKGEEAVLKLNPKNVRYVESLDKEVVTIVDKYGAEIGYSTKNIQILIQHDSRVLSPTSGIYTRSTEELKEVVEPFAVARVMAVMPLMYQKEQTSATLFGLMKSAEEFMEEEKPVPEEAITIDIIDITKAVIEDLLRDPETKDEMLKIADKLRKIQELEEEEKRIEAIEVKRCAIEQLNNLILRIEKYNPMGAGVLTETKMVLQAKLYEALFLLVFIPPEEYKSDENFERLENISRLVRHNQMIYWAIKVIQGKFIVMDRYEKEGRKDKILEIKEDIVLELGLLDHLLQIHRITLAIGDLLFLEKMKKTIELEIIAEKEKKIR